MKNWIVAGALVLVLGGVLFLSDRPAKTQNGLDLIRNNAQYVDANNKASMLVVPVWQKADSGGTLSDDEKNKLREGIKYFDAMHVFEPRHIASYFGAGKCYMLLGEKERAGERFAQAILNKQLDPDKDTEAVKLTIFEAHGLLSEVTLDLGVEEIANANSASQANDTKGADEAKKRSQLYFTQALDNANKAVAGVPTGFRYLIARANVYLALGNKELAKADVLKAKSLAPSDPKVLMTAKLMDIK